MFHNVYDKRGLFRCEIHDAIEKVFKTFAKAFNSEAAGDNIDKNVDKKEVILFCIFIKNL